MKKNVNMKIVIPVMVVVIILLIVLKSAGLLTIRSGVRLGFAGNDGIHKFNGSYSKITGVMKHTLRPSKGSDTIHCEIKSKSGSLHVEIIQKSDDTVLYDKEINGNETFDLPASGKVAINLSTAGHSGSYLFQY